MPIYRVNFTTSLLVDCESLDEAENIAYKNLQDEVKNNLSIISEINEISSIDGLYRSEQGSLPWRSKEKQSEPERTVDQILLGIIR